MEACPFFLISTNFDFREYKNNKRMYLILRYRGVGKLSASPGKR